MTIPNGQKAVFSFKITNGASVGTATFIAYEAMGPTYTGSPEVATDIEVKTATIPEQGERHYIEIDNTFGYDIDGIHISFNWDSPPFLEECCLRFVDDGETFEDNIPYIKSIKETTIYDLTKISVRGTNPEQYYSVDKDGNVSGVVFSTDGAPRSFTLQKGTYVYIGWTIEYRQSLVQEVANLKAQLTSSVSTLNTELASLTDVE
jgi:hypothetical protein